MANLTVNDVTIEFEALARGMQVNTFNVSLFDYDSGYDDGYADGFTAGVALSGPVIDNYIPAQMTLLATGDEITFDITSETQAVNLTDVIIVAYYSEIDLHEAVFYDSAFSPNYLSVSDTDSITDGWNFQIKRVGGWREVGDVQLFISASDAIANVSFDDANWTAALSANPTIANVDPVEASTLSTNDFIEFDLTDGLGLGFWVLEASWTIDTVEYKEVVWESVDGLSDLWGDSTQTPIGATGYSFSLRRDGGWRETGPVEIRIVSHDTAGNQTIDTLSYDATYDPAAGAGVPTYTAQMLTERRVTITFSEPVLDSSDLYDVSNYIFDGPTTITPNDVDIISSTVVRVRIVEELLNGEVYTVELLANTARASASGEGNVQTVENFTGLSVVPDLESAEPLSSTTLQVTFNKPVRQVNQTNLDDALNPANYTIINGIEIDVYSVQSVDAETVILTTQEQVANESYTLSAENIKDLIGNEI